MIIPSQLLANQTSDPLSLAFDRLAPSGPMMDLRTGQPAPLPEWASFWSGAEPLGAYINIPFCQTFCQFCGFFKVKPKPSQLEDYIRALTIEIANQGRLISGLGLKLSAVYIGGGTPSVLTAPLIDRLFSAINKNLPLKPYCEITFEARLSTLDRPKLLAIFGGGTNRLSVGIQSFNTDVRQQAGRLDRHEEVCEKLTKTIEINPGLTVLDLIYGLPGQSLEIFGQDLALAAQSQAQGMAFYLLKPIPGSNWHREVKNGLRPPLEGPEHLSKYYRLAVEHLTAAGLERISTNHFRRPSGDRNIYNHLSAGRHSIFALGAGSGGVHRGAHYFNTREVESYVEKILSGSEAVSTFHPAKPNYEILNNLSRQVQSGLINLERLELSEALRERLSALLNQYRTCGLMQPAQGGLALTLAGYFWSPNIEYALRSLTDQDSKEK
ncbi:MAG: radical SAM protein [Deltaproteobacteria bacterium]|jgi:oxygen-independent coproporphyrinogen-3 oxidase|nr:radical SAM protein [Deltaproteobacteria bacterium]